MLPILYGHRSDDPAMNVAATLDMQEDDHGLLVHGKFDETPTAEQVYNLVKSRHLSEPSFAYDTLDSAPVKLPDSTKANELRQVRLYEVSLVPVGANQDTAVLAVKGAPASRAASASLALRLRILGANA